jgi:gluconate 2-dehydrogenase gamma chain
MGIVPLAGLLDWSPVNVERATEHIAMLAAEPSAAPYAPKFFTAHEWKTVRMLADLIIPKDERSGSATDAKAPEFMDFMLAEKDATESNKVQMRGGLAWLDEEMKRRYGKDFIYATEAQRIALLDDIAQGRRTKPEFRRGQVFFERFRNSVASAFYSSAMGWADLQYMGNVFNPNWQGCPPEATRKLGVSYEEYDASLAKSRSK